MLHSFIFSYFGHFISSAEIINEDGQERPKLGSMQVSCSNFLFLFLKKKTKQNVTASIVAVCMIKKLDIILKFNKIKLSFFYDCCLFRSK